MRNNKKNPRGLQPQFLFFEKNTKCERFECDCFACPGDRPWTIYLQIPGVGSATHRSWAPQGDPGTSCLNTLPCKFDLSPPEVILILTPSPGSHKTIVWFRWWTKEKPYWRNGWIKILLFQEAILKSPLQMQVSDATSEYMQMGKTLLSWMPLLIWKIPAPL